MGEGRVKKSGTLFTRLSATKALVANSDADSCFSDKRILVEMNLIPLLIEISLAFFADEWTLMTDDNVSILACEALHILCKACREQPEYSIECGIMKLLKDIILHDDLYIEVSKAAVKIRRDLAFYSIRKRCENRKTELIEWRDKFVLKDDSEDSTSPVTLAASLLACMLQGHPPPEFYTAATDGVLGTDFRKEMDLKEECLWTLAQDVSFMGPNFRDGLLSILPSLITVLKDINASPAVTLPAVKIINLINAISSRCSQAVFDAGCFRVFNIQLDSCNTLLLDGTFHYLIQLFASYRFRDRMLNENVFILTNIVSTYFRMSVRQNDLNHMTHQLWILFLTFFQRTSPTQVQNVRLMLCNAPIVALLTEMFWFSTDPEIYFVIASLLSTVTMKELIQNVVKYSECGALSLRSKPLECIFISNRVEDREDKLRAIWVMLELAMGADMFEARSDDKNDGETIYHRCREVAPHSYECLRHAQVMTLLAALTQLPRLQQAFIPPRLPIKILKQLHQALIGIAVFEEEAK